MQNSAESASLAMKFTSDDIALTVMPLFHVGGMWYHLFPSYLSGCTTIIEESFDPLRTLELLKAQKVTNVHLVPTMIGALLNVPGVEKQDLEHFRLMYYAGSSIPEEMLRRAMSVFKQTKFLQAYGSTEGGSCTILKPEDHDEAVMTSGRGELLCSCGKPFGDLKLKIVDPQGDELPRDKIGEVAVLSKRTMFGYWKNPDADRNAIQDGWVRMGDLAYQDNDGYVFIVGRKHDMIVTGGENVFPFEVENALYQNPKILEAAVFGVPDRKWVEAVAAAVVLQDGVESDAAEIINDCKTRLAGYKCPKVIVFTDSLPKSPAGKVLKRKLRENYGKPQ
jgi:acyl-CoA synthetase (AMP-forming)/AMP-acid ligase II